MSNRQNNNANKTNQRHSESKHNLHTQHSTTTTKPYIYTHIKNKQTHTNDITEQHTQQNKIQKHKETTKTHNT